MIGALFRNRRPTTNLSSLRAGGSTSNDCLQPIVLRQRQRLRVLWQRWPPISFGEAWLPCPIKATCAHTTTERFSSTNELTCRGRCNDYMPRETVMRPRSSSATG